MLMLCSWAGGMWFHGISSYIICSMQTILCSETVFMYIEVIWTLLINWCYILKMKQTCTLLHFEIMYDFCQVGVLWYSWIKNIDLGCTWTSFFVDKSQTLLSVRAYQTCLKPDMVSAIIVRFSFLTYSFLWCVIYKNHDNHFIIDFTPIICSKNVTACLYHVIWEIVTMLAA